MRRRENPIAMPAPFTRRLAGIRFVTQPPQLPERLPRMDIAVFIGFASAGPMQRPVVVEDAAQFAAIFGDDLPLAWDAEKGIQSFACLAPAVRAFFRNGGRRCWVIRVAGEPETNFFPLPGLACVNGGALSPAFARARSPGSWFDSFRAATALAVRGIEVVGRDAAWQTIYAAGVRQNDLRAGDLLRLRFTGTSEETFFLVESLAAVEPSPPDSAINQVAISVTLLGTLRPLLRHEISGQPFDLTWERPPRSTAGARGEVVAPPDSPPDDEDGRVTLALLENSLPPAGTEGVVPFSPPPGALLQIAWSPTDRCWFQVEESQLSLGAGAAGSSRAQIIGRVFSWSAGLPSPAAAFIAAGERLTFELRTQRGDTDSARLVDLAFLAGHPRFWNGLPNDAQSFASVTDEAYDPYAALWSEAREKHFPLAGNEDLAAQFIPVGMSALAEPAMAAESSALSKLERDGLKEFSSSLFLDERLLDSGVSTLIADADFIRYEMPGAPPLTGIHAALEIEEASLIAVPDAIQRGWQPWVSPGAASPPESGPVPHPGWWHYLECNPPESPPAWGQDEPSRAHFLKCDLRVLAPPVLAVDGPDPSGRFVLEWTAPDPDANFILEEATEPDFSDAVALPRGKETSHSILARDPGHYYYRVRAEAEGESSNWSNEVLVEISPGTRWQLEPAGDFKSGTLLEVHRALLRFCAARGDIMAVLALPEHFREDESLAYVSRLKSGQTPAAFSPVRPLGTGEEAAFSYAAMYHPWLLVREDAGGLRWMPPDGATSGLIALRSLARGAWIAPANEAYSGVVALSPLIAAERQLEFLLAQLNLIRQEPRGFLALSADTLSVDDELRPINVRRLLILLRKAALRLGMTFVFEPNDRVLRRVVQGAFESIMQQLFMRGAFAGATPDASYRVVTDDTLNTPQDFDQGRFRVDLKVAPALPMSFLTVRLVQMGERAIATEII
jgi:hypothetical protein